MSKLEQRFAAAAETARKLPPPGRAKLLELYGLYKQSHEGDALQQRPGLANLRGRAKHDAWAALQGMAREAAMRRYIALVAELQAAPATEGRCGSRMPKPHMLKQYGFARGALVASAPFQHDYGHSDTVVSKDIAGSRMSSSGSYVCSEVSLAVGSLVSSMGGSPVLLTGESPVPFPLAA